jgi:hypothetical protein
MTANFLLGSGWIALAFQNGPAYCKVFSHFLSPGVSGSIWTQALDLEMMRRVLNHYAGQLNAELSLQTRLI